MLLTFDYWDTESAVIFSLYGVTYYCTPFHAL